MEDNKGLYIVMIVMIVVIVGLGGTLVYYLNNYANLTQESANAGNISTELTSFKSTKFNVSFKYPTAFGKAKANSMILNKKDVGNISVESVTFEQTNLKVVYPYLQYGFNDSDTAPTDCTTYVSKSSTLGSVKICNLPLDDLNMYTGFVVKDLGSNRVVFMTTAKSLDKYNTEIDYMKAVIDNFTATL